MAATQPPGRATSIEEMGERMSLVFTKEAWEAGLAFKPAPTDVIISPYAKCGTTWLQQIVHGLRTGGDMDFDDISRVVPWIETAYSLDIDLEAEQSGTPKAFKSHLPWDLVPKGCRYVVSLRDPRDALVSFHRFMEGWIVEPGAVPIEDMARVRLFERSPRDYWSHFVGWWSQRENPDVLLLTFESMKQDLPKTVQRVASFIGLDADDHLLDVATHQASFGFMAENRDRFDDLMIRELMERSAGIPADGDSAKVRSGEVGGYRTELSEELAGRIDDVWVETIGEECGLDSYQAAIDILA